MAVGAVEARLEGAEGDLAAPVGTEAARRAS